MNRMMIVSLLFFGATAPAFAGENVAPRAEAHAQLKAERFERLETKLGLDAAAGARFRATMDKYRAQLKPLQKDARETRLELDRALAAPSPDRPQIAKLTDKLTRDRAEMRTIGEQRQAELKSQLTPEQYAKLLVIKHGRGHAGRHLHHGRRATEAR